MRGWPTSHGESLLSTSLSTPRFSMAPAGTATRNVGPPLHRRYDRMLRLIIRCPLTLISSPGALGALGMTELPATDGE